MVGRLGTLLLPPHDLLAITREFICLQATRSGLYRCLCRHGVVRVLVQSALRPQGLTWGAYQLNHALMLALDDAASQTQWLGRSDPLAPAAVDLEHRDAMAAGFDAVAR